jgi:choline-sulfatase
MALNIDLGPTFAALAGVTLTDADGQSLERVIDGTAPSWRSDFLTEGWPANRQWATVREARWKYTETVLDLSAVPAPTVEAELYDLEVDPFELTNIAGDPMHAARVQAMHDRLLVLRPLWPFDADPTLEDEEE